MYITTALDKLNNAIALEIRKTKSFVAGEAQPTGTLSAEAVERLQKRLDWIQLTLDENVTACEAALPGEMREQKPLTATGIGASTTT
jgi:hypothetical protein